MKTYISPIAIDLGAKHTGVYRAFYQAGCKPNEIDRSGVVYNLERDKYTILMKDRTQKRHQRRGFDRRQMAKRLFRLIWEKELKLEWNDNVSKVIGFLFNRRGFSYLTEEYDSELLSQFPTELFEILPVKLQQMVDNVDVKKNSEYVDIAHALKIFTENDIISEALQIINNETDFVNKELVYYNTLRKLEECCKNSNFGKDFTKDKSLLSVSKWIIERLHEDGMTCIKIDKNIRGNIDIIAIIKEKPDIANSILKNIPEYKDKLDKLKQSEWNFKSSNPAFKNNDETPGTQVNFDSDIDFKKQLNNLGYALYVIHQELISGGRYRIKYFEEVREVLAERNHNSKYLSEFCTKLQSGKFTPLNVDSLVKLIGHISNFELKPLRKYFNDKKHYGHDYWDKERLDKFFRNWILNEWRVVPEKNPRKINGGDQDYGVLCKDLIKWKNGIVKFLMEYDPIKTIPPYQNNNNRRPPRCQSLVLNAKFLNTNYPDWKKWFNLLKEQLFIKDYLGDIEKAYMALKTSKDNPYYFDKLTGDFQKDSQKLTLDDRDARVFHLILDRVKNEDPLLLNEIYSCVKKIRQLKRLSEKTGVWEEKLKEVLNKSILPDQLKTKPELNNDDIYKPMTFLHLVCKYYKERQRARDGRLFIHPEYKKHKKRGFEKTNRFESENNILTYCNLKPRQKKYQSIIDVANIFQINHDKLKEIIGSDDDERVRVWLKQFKAGRKGLEGLSRDCAAAQKEYRGNLKNIIQLGKEKKLMNLVEEARQISLQIAKVLFTENSEKLSQKFESVFSFAQLYNIMFTDRNGNSKTCPLCSFDNSRRMEIYSDNKVKAQRLPAISTRLIDGAVMRMIRIITKSIANDSWSAIETQLESGSAVRVPIITESNRFEFEPSVKYLKGQSFKLDGSEQIFNKKEQRIKNEGNSICPYTGAAIGESGELDHIVPRVSEWGTLNDEANFIYASKKGNNDKGRSEYGLKNINDKYKKSVFGTTDDTKIEEWIINTIWNSERESFSFGNYRSFINLDLDQRKAFRHSLFLLGKPIRQKVLDAINNKTRTLVNGTQRYFAEMLANELHKKSLKIDKSKNLSFDFFQVEAFGDSHGDGIKEWRKLYQDASGINIESYEKKAGKKQKPYSHLMDAQIAFLIAADKHRNEGSFLLNIPDNISPIPVNKETGEIIEKTLLTDIWVAPDKMKEPVQLERRKPIEGFVKHRSFTRDSFYADRYLPILMKKNKGKIEMRAGFDWKNSGEWSIGKTTLPILKQLLPLINQRRYFDIQDFDALTEIEEVFEIFEKVDYFQKQIKQKKYIYITIDRQALHEYWCEYNNTSSGNTFDKDDKLFDFLYSKIGYRTEKKKIESESDLEDVIKNQSKYFEKKFGKAIILPYLNNWQDCQNAWKNRKKDGISFEDFIHDYFSTLHKHGHQKVRKVFSLPVKTGEGRFLLKRRGWDNTHVFQIINDSDSRSMENKAVTTVVTESGELGEKLNSWTKSKNFVKLSKNVFSDGEEISSTEWFKIDEKEYSLPEECMALWYKVDNTTRPMIKFCLNVDAKKIKETQIKNIFLKNPFCRGRFDPDKKKGLSSEDVLIKFWVDNVKELKRSESFEYKGASFTNDQKRAIMDSLNNGNA